MALKYGETRQFEIGGNNLVFTINRNAREIASGLISKGKKSISEIEKTAVESPNNFPVYVMYGLLKTAQDTITLKQVEELYAVAKSETCFGDRWDNALLKMYEATEVVGARVGELDFLEETE